MKHITSKLVLDVKMILRAKKIAMRNGKWFKLHPDERILINLTIRTLNFVKSCTLIKILLKIFEKISEKLVYLYKVYTIGLKIAGMRMKQAYKIGYRNAGRLLKDIKYIFYLGATYIYTPQYYRPAINNEYLT